MNRQEVTKTMLTKAMLTKGTATKYAARGFATAVALLFLASSAFAGECVPEGDSSKQTAVTRCTEDPSCVLVGETHMLEWKSSAPTKVVVVCIHGLGLCARAYKPLAKELSDSGIDGYGINVRGFGPDRGNPERAKLNCTETVGDVRELLVGIRKSQPDYRIFLVGESMGGALAIRIASENPQLVDGVICSAPAWKLLKLRRTALRGIVELIFYHGSGPGPTGRAILHQATEDKDLAEHFLSDPSHRLKLSVGEATSFLKFISKTDDFAKQLTKPVLFVQGLNDRLVSARGVAKLFRVIPSRRKAFLIVGEAEHLVLEEGMYSPEVVGRLIDFMKNEETSAFSVFQSVNDKSLSRQEQKRLSAIQQLTGLTSSPLPVSAEAAH